MREGRRATLSTTLGADKPEARSSSGLRLLTQQTGEIDEGTKWGGKAREELTRPSKKRCARLRRGKGVSAPGTMARRRDAAR